MQRSDHLDNKKLARLDKRKPRFSRFQGRCFAERKGSDTSTRTSAALTCSPGVLWSGPLQIKGEEAPMVTGGLHHDWWGFFRSIAGTNDGRGTSHQCAH